MAVKCLKCQFENRDGSLFCGKCGVKLVTVFFARCGLSPWSKDMSFGRLFRLTGTRMKRKFLIPAALLSITMCSLLIGCASERTEFQLSEWKVIDDNGAAALLIRFTANKAISLRLTDPDGLEVGTDYCVEGVTGSKLHLADYGNTPKAGQYKLLACAVDNIVAIDLLKEGQDKLLAYAGKNIVATETFDFEGAKVTISEVSPTWYLDFYESCVDKYGNVTTNCTFYDLIKVSVTATNDGDLPVYIGTAEITVNGEKGTSIIDGEVLPGQTKAFDAELYQHMPRVTPGSKAVTLTLKPSDSASEVIASYSATVTPSE